MTEKNQALQKQVEQKSSERLRKEIETMKEERFQLLDEIEDTKKSSSKMDGKISQLEADKKNLMSAHQHSRKELEVEQNLTEKKQQEANELRIAVSDMEK